MKTNNEKTLKNRALMHINRSWYPEGTARQVAAVWIGDNCDRRKELANIEIPAMIIQGDKYPIVPLTAGKEVADAIPGAELCIIKGMGYDLSEKFIDRMVQCILKNVKRK